MRRLVTRDRGVLSILPWLFARRRSRKIRCGAVFLCLALASSAPLAGQTISGRVLSTGTSDPIPLATVSLVDSAGRVVVATATDERGEFTFGARSSRGGLFLHAQALGYLDMMEGPIPEAGTSELRVEMRLEPRPVELDGLDVVTERRVPSLERAGFYQRMEAGPGFHMDRRELERRGNPQNLGHLFRTVPGVSVGNGGMPILRGMGTLGPYCPYKVFLDGMLVVSDPFSDVPPWHIGLIDPLEVEAIEVYRRPSEIPVAYSNIGGCGVILIWSQSG